MQNFRYFIPRNKRTTLTVTRETKEAVNLFAMLKGYTVNEATFRAIRPVFITSCGLNRIARGAAQSDYRALYKRFWANLPKN
jgi:hypothetical protein